MKETFYLTNYQTWNEEEIIDLWSTKVQPENVKILIDHLSIPELAEYILSFVEIDGIIHLNLGNGEGLLPVIINKNK